MKYYIALFFVCMFGLFFGQTAEEYLDLGLTKSAEGNHKSAINEYNKALKINPNFTEAFVNRGISKSKLGDYRGAISDYSKALTINPKSSETFLQVGD